MFVFGVKIDNLSSEETKERLAEFLVDRRQHYVVLPYSLFLLKARKDREFKNILNNASLSLADGIGPVWVARILNKEKLNRLTGVDLVSLVCSLAAERGKGVFLFGGRAGVAEKAGETLKKKFPGLKIAGTRAGYDFDNETVLKEISESGAEILLVALGMGTQEKWIAENLSKTPSIKIAAGVGGAFDFISGQVKRAPEWMRQAGLEWLFRMFVQPEKIGRNLKAVFGLIAAVFQKLLFGKRPEN